MCRSHEQNRGTLVCPGFAFPEPMPNTKHNNNQASARLNLCSVVSIPPITNGQTRVLKGSKLQTVSRALQLCAASANRLCPQGSNFVALLHFQRQRLGPFCVSTLLMPRCARAIIIIPKRYVFLAELRLRLRENASLGTLIRFIKSPFLHPFPTRSPKRRNEVSETEISPRKQPN
jgi:hypothetical protein